MAGGGSEITGRVLCHGVDVVEVDRIAAMLADHGDRFAERCFTESERSYCESCGRRTAEHFAARFAAKEATLKALGTGLTARISWTDIAVTRDASGRPGLALTGRAAEVASGLGVRAWLVSLSHTERTALASVIGLG